MRNPVGAEFSHSISGGDGMALGNDNQKKLVSPKRVSS